MADIAVQPFFLEDCLLKIGANNYEAHVSKVLITPRNTVVWKGLKLGSRFGRTLWQAQFDFAQDWETASSLSRYLLENDGESVDAEFHPQAEGQGFAVGLLLVAGGIGGTVETVATSQVTLECTGKPEYLES